MRTSASTSIRRTSCGSRDIPRATADLLQSRIVFRLNSREAAHTILDGGVSVAANIASRARETTS
jgi:hypothetical protein